MTLRAAGHLDHGPTAAASGLARGPVRLSLSGIGLLSRRNLEHGHHSTEAVVPQHQQKKGTVP